MARRVKKGGARGRVVAWQGLLTATARAACYEVSPYIALLWREHVEYAFANADAYLKRANERCPGFWDTFACELAWRLYARDEREIPADKRSPHTKLRGELHAYVSQAPGWEDLRKACAGRTSDAIQEAGTLAARIAGMLDDMQAQKRADREREQAESGALGDLTGGTAGGAPGGQGAGDQDGGDQSAGVGFGEAGELRTPDQLDLTQGAQDVARKYELDALANVKREIQAPESIRESWIRQDSAMAEVLRIAGRVNEVCSRLAEDKRSRRSVERSGYAPTRNVASLVPGELARLAGVLGPGEQILASKRLADGASTGWDPQGRGETGRGPLVIVVDCSGSMADPEYVNGERMATGKKLKWAKAIALGIARECARTGRRFHIVSYDSRYLRDWSTTGADESLSIEQIIANMQAAGGTCWDVALNTALNVIEHAPRFRKADVVHITDGQPSEFDYQAVLDRAKSLNARIHGIAVGTSAGVLSAPGSYLSKCSHTVVAVQDVHEDTKAIETLVNALA